MRAVILIVFATLLSTCGDTGSGPILLEENLAGPQLVWRRDRFALSESSINETKSSKLVMVSFDAAGHMAELLDHLGGRVLTRKQGAKNSYALVSINNQQELDFLAHHSHHSRGFACGNIEVIDAKFAFANLLLTSNERLAPIYTEISQFTAVSSALSDVNSSQITTSIATLSSLSSRHHSVNPGASNTVKTLFESAAGAMSGVSHTLVTHTDSAQNSLVTSLPGTRTDDEIVIIGAHLDSINPSNNSDAPGADDNASGIATMVEALRVIASRQLTFARRVEFHAYAAEEVGLVGSQDIASTYKQSGKKVAAMLQLDMNSFSSDPSDTTIHIVETDTSKNLQRSLKDLMHNYLGGDFSATTLESGTSDHKSWHNQGYAAIFPFENPNDYNPNIHTARDTASSAGNSALNARFAKLVLAFLAHHAGIDSVAEQASAAADAAIAGFKRDLPIALLRDGDLYRPVIAVEESIASVEFCTVASKTATGCNYERQLLTLAQTQSGRKVFAVPDSLSLVSDQYLRLFSYDQSDKLVDQRTIRIKKR